MKLLITGDLHLDAVTAGNPRLHEVREAFGQVIARVRKERIDAVLFLGDLCNPDRGSRSLRAVTAGIEMFRTLVQQTGCAVVMVAGNHDVVQDGSGLTSLSPIRVAHGGREPELGDLGVLPRQDAPGTTGLAPPGKLLPGSPGGRQGVARGQQTGDGDPCPVPAYAVTPGVVAVAEVPMLLELQGDGRPVHVLALPFTSSVRAYDPPTVVKQVGAWRISTGNACPLVVAGHLTIEGAMLGSETTDMARGRSVEFPVAACSVAEVDLLCNGHYHKRQTVRGVECPGSLVRLSFGEEHNEPRWIEVQL